MHSVKSPEPWDSMKGAVNPVLDHIGEEHNGHELNDERQGCDPIADSGHRRKSKDGFRRKESEEGKNLHHQTADEVIKNVFAPFRAKNFLLGFSWENAFERDKKQPGEYDVQN